MQLFHGLFINHVGLYVKIKIQIPLRNLDLIKLPKEIYYIIQQVHLLYKNMKLISMGIKYVFRYLKRFFKNSIYIESFIFRRFHNITFTTYIQSRTQNGQNGGNR